MSETWIVFKADGMSTLGWEERKLLPSGDLTDIIWENWDTQLAHRVGCVRGTNPYSIDV